MAISYPLVAKEVAFRAGLVQDGNSGDRLLYYNNTSIDTFIDSVEVPSPMLRDTILMAEHRIAEYIGYSKDFPYRAALEEQSTALLNGAQIPTTSALGKPFVGAFSAVRDSSTKAPYTEQPKRIVYRFIENPGGFWKIQPRYYAIEGNRIYHTGSTVEITGCVWSRTEAELNYTTGGTSVLPAVFEPVLVAMSLALISTEGWFKEEAVYYKNLADSMLESIETGKAQRLTLPSMPVSAARPAAAD